MKQLKLKTSILIASIYAAVFYGAMSFINKVIWAFGPMYIDAAKAYKMWKAWTPLVMGMIAILLFGFLVYKTDWKKKK
ncbi:MAG: hypothetical protein K9N05_08100 [Candidatus Marinimicrobia bacterium]|nr:hypothetical protein [Candidatus Neomarinimicrobiota bacterium]